MGKGSSPAVADRGPTFPGVGVAVLPTAAAVDEGVVATVIVTGAAVGTSEASTGISVGAGVLTVVAGMLIVGVLKFCPEHPLIKSARRMKTRTVLIMFTARAQG
jgi:hypothetical protein